MVSLITELLVTLLDLFYEKNVGVIRFITEGYIHEVKTKEVVALLDRDLTKR